MLKSIFYLYQAPLKVLKSANGFAFLTNLSTFEHGSALDIVRGCAVDIDCIK